jgi:hypothetical protein
MGTFGIQRTGRGIASSSGSVRAQFDPGTGGAVVGQAIGEFGVATTEIFKRKQAMDDDLTRADAARIMIRAEGEIDLFRENNADTRLWSKNASETMKTARFEVGALKSSSRMKRFIQSDSDIWSSDKALSFQIGEIRQKKVDTKSVLIDQLIQAQKSGDAKEAGRATEIFRSGMKGIESPAEIDIIERVAIQTGTKASLENQIVLDPEGMKAKFDAEIDARKEGKTTNEAWSEIFPDDKDIDRLSDAARIEISQRGTRDEAILTKSAAEVEPDWLTRWISGTLTQQEVLAWKPPITDPKSIREWNDIQEEWIRKIGQTAGKGNGWAAVMQDIDLNPKEWTPSRIYAQSPKLITPEDASKMVSHWRTLTEGKNTGSTSLHTRYQSILTSQAKIGIFGKDFGKDTDDGRETTNKVNDISRQLTQFMINSPQASTDDWKKFNDTTTIKKKEQPTLGLFKRLSPILTTIEIFKLRGKLKQLEKAKASIQQIGVGREVVDKSGFTWVLIRKGKTPAEDVWRKQ